MFKSKSKRFPKFEEKPVAREKQKKCQEQDLKKWNNQSTQSMKKIENINLLLVKKKQENVKYVPSIPGKIEKFGYVATEDSLAYPQQISKKDRFDGQKNSSPGPCEYAPNSKPKIKNILKFSNPRNNSIKSNSQYSSS